MLNDPSMKEIVEDFCKETDELLVQLSDTLEAFEAEQENTSHLEKFGQIIDRIMGAAKSIGASEMATFCELGKIIGYKSSQTVEPALLNVVNAVLFDAVDLLNKMNKQLLTGESKSLENLSTDAFASRLRWLQEKFDHIERASCNYQEDQVKELNQSSIDDLLESLGL